MLHYFILHKIFSYYNTETFQIHVIKRISFGRAIIATLFHKVHRKVRQGRESFKHDVWQFILTFTLICKCILLSLSLLPSFQFNLIQTNYTRTVIFICFLFTEILSKQSTDEQDKDRKRKLSFCLDSGITDKDLSRPAKTQEAAILSLKLWHCGCICLL